MHECTNEDNCVICKLEQERDKWKERAGKHLTQLMKVERERDGLEEEMEQERGNTAKWYTEYGKEFQRRQQAEQERDEARRQLRECDRVAVAAIQRHLDNEIKAVGLANEMTIRAVKAEQERDEWKASTASPISHNMIIEARRERDEAREKLKGVGVEEFYALQSKCRELASEQAYAKREAIKWNDEAVRLRKANADLLEVLQQIENESAAADADITQINGMAQDALKEEEQ